MANIRTPRTAAQARVVIQQVGWKVRQESRVDSKELQDADWEITESFHAEFASEHPRLVRPKSKSFVTSPFRGATLRYAG
jgi:hypothetical protein